MPLSSKNPVNMQAKKIDQIVSSDWKPVQQDLSKYEAIEVALNRSSKPVTVWVEAVTRAAGALKTAVQVNQ